jgi:pimeloyl-CoA synthetase
LITKTIKSELSSELTPLQNQIDYLKIKLDDQEQYTRRTNLKISGIKEQDREENTDDLVLDVINNLKPRV